MSDEEKDSDKDGGEGEGEEKAGDKLGSKADDMRKKRRDPPWRISSGAIHLKNGS